MLEPHLSIGHIIALTTKGWGEVRRHAACLSGNSLKNEPFLARYGSSTPVLWARGCGLSLSFFSSFSFLASHFLSLSFLLSLPCPRFRPCDQLTEIK